MLSAKSKSAKLMKNIKKQIIIVALVALIFVFNIVPALAQTPIGDAMTNGTNNKGGGVAEMIKEAYGNVTSKSMVEVLIKIMNYLLTFLAILFFLGLIYAGYLWMTARGNEEEITKAKKITREIVIGLVIILLSRLFTEFILMQLGNFTQQ
jgi:uncharacterized BrkB/YihY/UPF0761 family membrane protein